MSKERKKHRAAEKMTERYSARRIPIFEAIFAKELRLARIIIISSAMARTLR